MAEQSKTPSDQLHEELTAYLDGELDAEGVRRVEERLARDDAYQKELHRLERTWDLLDRLPRVPVTEDFSKSTIEMIAVAACEEASAAPAEWARQRRRRQVAGLLAVAAAGLIGFFMGRWAWPNPNDELLRDLNVLQNFDLYYQADNIEFLKALERENLFPEGDADHG